MATTPLLSAAQPAEPATTQAIAWELSADTRTRLAQIEDFTLGFDRPGFYAVALEVARAPRSPGFAQEPVAVDDWSVFLERPGTLRGRPVTISGTIGRNKDPWVAPQHPQIGPLGQLELLKRGQPVSVTLILTGVAEDISVGATVRATGYFVMTRKYLDSRGREQYAGLIVAPGITMLSRPAPQEISAWRHAWWFVAALLLGLLVTWIVLRRSVGGPPRDVHTLRARHDAPLHLGDELAEWAEKSGVNPDEAPPDDSRPLQS